MKKWLLLPTLALLAVSIAACGGGNNNNNGGVSPSPTAGTPPATDVAAADAETLVKANCIACHGAELQGAGAPSLETIGAKYSDTQIHDIVANGRGGMPAFKGTLTDDEIAAISAWLAARK